MGAVGGDELMRWVKAEGGGGGAAGGGEERIVVSVRVRPLNDKELERGDPSDWECINNTTIISKSSLPERSMQPTAYTFGKCWEFIDFILFNVPVRMNCMWLFELSSVLEGLMLCLRHVF